MQIQSYKNKNTKRLCTDFSYSKKQLNARTAEKLFALVNLIQGSDSLKDIALLPQYKVHSLKGSRKGEFAMDIDGRKSSYRLIIEPEDIIDESLNNLDFLSKCSTIKCISIQEVSNHYE